MTSLRRRIIDGVIRLERGYVNDPLDSGGETNFGITKRVARAFGYDGRMKDMHRSVAFSIYVARYWNTVRADSMARLSEAVTTEVVDTGVNMGVIRSGKFLQRVLNVLNLQSRYYADIPVDGMVGNMTIAALSSALDKHDEDLIVKMLNCLQGEFYISLAERREKDERFVKGWFNQRVG